MENNIPSGPVSPPGVEPGELYPGHAGELRKRAALEERIGLAHAAVLPGALREAFAGSATFPVAVSGVPPETLCLQPVTLGLAANLDRIHSPLLEVIRIMREVFSGPQAETESPEKTRDNSPGQSESPGAAPGNDKTNQNLDFEGHLKRVSKSDSIAALLAAVNARVAALKFEEEQIAETVFVFIKPQKYIRQLLDKGGGTFREAAMEQLGDKLHPAQMASLQRACAQHYVASFATIIGYGSPPPEEGAAVFRAPSPSAVTGLAGG